jgi:hypothetical protein
MTEASDLAPAVPPPKPPRRRRWLIVGGSVLVLVLVLGVVVPRFAAGWLAQEQLERMGIANQGVTSLTIDLWNSEIDLGTVEFWSADAEHGRIENVSMAYDVANLFAGRALVDQLRVRGIDIRISRDEDGSITVNGIKLADLLGPADEEDEDADRAREETDEAGFGVGLDGFLLENSRALLETDLGGELVVEIDRLVIEDIRSWDPDQPAVVGLTALVNDIEVQADAQVHLFSETIMADAHVRLASIDLDKVTRFTGPLGFDRRDGEVRVDMVTSIQIEPAGRVMMAGYADLTHEGAALARPNLNYRVGRQRVDIDGVVIAEPVAAETNGQASTLLKAAGSAQVRSDQVEVRAAEAGALTFDQAEIHLTDLALLRDSKGRIRLDVVPSVQVTAAEVSGPLGIETTSIRAALPALAATLDGASIAVRAAGTAEAEDTGLTLPGAEGAAGPSLKTGTLRAAFDDLVISLAPERTKIAGHLGLELSDLAAVAPLAMGEAEASVGPIKIDLADVGLRTSAGGLGLVVRGALDVKSLQATLPGATDGASTSIGLDGVSAAVAGLDVTLDSSGAADVSGQASLSLADLAAEVPLGETAAMISAKTFDVALPRLQAATSEQALQLGVTGSAEVDGLQAQLSGGESPLNVQLERVTSDFDGVEAAIQSSGTTQASGALTLALNEVAADAPYGNGAADVTTGELGLTLSELQLSLTDGGASIEAVGSNKLVGFRANLPAADNRPPMSVGLAGLEVTIDQLAAEVGPETPTWQVKSTIAGESISADVEGEGAASVRLGTLALDGLEADHGLAASARSLEIAGLEVELSDRTIGAFAGDGSGPPGSETEVAQAVPASAEPAPPAVRLGMLTIEQPAVVRYRDTSLEPAVDVEAELHRFEIANLDTADPSQRTDVRVEATINRRAELALSGWAALSDPPDLDLDVELRDLELASFSPYAADAVGMDMESGVLGTKLAAAASGGDLEGKIDVEVEDLILIPVSEADAQAASAAIGMPVGAVVGLLEDPDGRIKLGFPISGTVQEPQVDPKEAITKAVAATLKTLFPPTAIAGLLMSEGGSFEFRPVTFDEGSDELSDEGREMVDGLMALLREKPRLEVLLCGRATPADAGEPLREANASAMDAKPAAASDAEPQAATEDPMIELAKARALAVETYLLEEHGLPAERLHECRPRYDPADSGPPRVDLLLT